MSTPRKLAEQERAERREHDRQYAQQAIEQLRSSDGWRQWLHTRASFRTYTLVISGGRCPRAGGIGQLPTATCHRQLAIG